MGIVRDPCVRTTSRLQLPTRTEHFVVHGKSLIEIAMASACLACISQLTRHGSTERQSDRIYVSHLAEDIRASTDLLAV